MKFSANDIISMGQEEFCSHFFNKYVLVIRKDDAVIQGIISEIGLSAIMNKQTQDYLPVTIKIDSKIINIVDIKSIETI